MDAIDFLGHRVTIDAHEPQVEKVAAIRDVPSPTNLASLSSALGLFTYYRKIVRGFSVITSPLHSLLRKGVPWSWGADQEVA